MQQNFVEDKGDRYILPLREDYYLLIPLSTLNHLNSNYKEHVIKIYIYLVKQFDLHEGHYSFTAEELGGAIGIKVKNYSNGYAVINNALNALVDARLIRFYKLYDGQVYRRVMTGYSLYYIPPEIEEVNKPGGKF